MSMQLLNSDAVACALCVRVCVCVCIDSCDCFDSTSTGEDVDDYPRW